MDDLPMLTDDVSLPPEDLVSPMPSLDSPSQRNRMSFASSLPQLLYTEDESSESQSSSREELLFDMLPNLLFDSTNDDEGVAADNDDDNETLLLPPPPLFLNDNASTPAPPPLVLNDNPRTCFTKALSCDQLIVVDNPRSCFRKVQSCESLDCNDTNRKQARKTRKGSRLRRLDNRWGVNNCNADSPLARPPPPSTFHTHRWESVTCCSAKNSVNKRLSNNASSPPSLPKRRLDDDQQQERPIGDSNHDVAPRYPRRSQLEDSLKRFETFTDTAPPRYSRQPSTNVLLDDPAEPSLDDNNDSSLDHHHVTIQINAQVSYEESKNDDHCFETPKLAAPKTMTLLNMQRFGGRAPKCKSCDVAPKHVKRALASPNPLRSLLASTTTTQANISPSASCRDNAFALHILTNAVEQLDEWS